MVDIILFFFLVLVRYYPEGGILKPDYMLRPQHRGGGYQPTHGGDSSNPPQGGSGVSSHRGEPWMHERHVS